MIKNYLLLSFRNLRKNRLYSVVNILTLGLAVTTSILILNYVVFELSYDQIHEQRDRIYRVESQFYEGSTLTDDWATSSYGYGVAMNDEIAGIEDFVRLDINNTEQIVSYADRKYRERTITYTEPSFFDIFSFTLADGDRHTALTGPGKVVISKKAASKYFGAENPMGKRLRFNSSQGEINCEVTGILEDIPQNSSIDFDFFISWKTLPDWTNTYWYRHEVYTYVLLDSGVNPRGVEAAFPAMAEKYKTEDALRNKKWAVVLNSLADIHLSPMKQYEREAKGNANSLAALAIIAIAILVIAWVNYVNLATARSAERASEVGVRKVSGARRGQLIGQFLCDSMVINLIAFALSALLVGLISPLFSSLTGKVVTFVILSNPLFWLAIVGILVVGVVLSGLYPAYLISAVSPLIVLTGSYVRTRGAGLVRRSLVVVQFVAAIVLISGTVIVWHQIRYMQSTPLGVDIESVMAIKFPAHEEDFQVKLQAFKRQIQQNPATRNVSFSNSVPGMEVATFLSNRLASDATLQNRLYEMVVSDYDFTQTYRLPVIAGRTFSEDYLGDELKLVINRAAMAALNIAKPEDAIGQKVFVETLADPLEIVGVVENYHQQVLSKGFTPLMFIRENCIEWISLKYISIRYDGSGDVETYRKQIESAWQQFFPQSTFDSFDVDKFFEAGYSEDNRFALIFAIFGMLALAISVVGLLVLTLFSLSVRRREIALRKIFGAFGRDIFVTISGEFFILAAISILIGVPIAWWVMHSYLDSYPFRVAISAWMFVVPILVVLVVTFGTIGLQIAAAMRSKPRLR